MREAGFSGTAITYLCDPRTFVALERFAVSMAGASATARPEKGSREPHQLATCFFGTMIRLGFGSWTRELGKTS